MSCFWTALQGVTQVCASVATGGSEFWGVDSPPAFPAESANNSFTSFDMANGCPCPLQRVTGGGLGISAADEIALVPSATPDLDATPPALLFNNAGAGFAPAAAYVSAYNTANGTAYVVPALVHTPGTNLWTLSFLNAPGGTYALASGGVFGLGAQIIFDYNDFNAAGWHYELIAPE